MATTATRRPTAMLKGPEATAVLGWPRRRGTVS
jgi:hypothetical protein